MLAGGATQGKASAQGTAVPGRREGHTAQGVTNMNI